MTTVPPSKRNPKLYEYERLRDQAAGRPRHVPVEPTRRKVQALCALGWSATDVARALGITQQSMSKILNRPDRIRRSTAERVDRVYTAWEMRIPPETTWTKRNRTNALKRGWLPPLAWEDIEQGIVAETEKPRERPRPDRLDEEEVAAVLGGDWRRKGLSKAEKTEVVRRWLASGRSEASLCRLTGWRQGRYSPNNHTHQEAS